MEEAYKLFSSNLCEVLDLCKLVEILPGRLYLASFSTHRRHLDTTSLHFFSFNSDIDITSKYNYVDKKYTFKPLDLGCLAQYIQCLNNKMYSRKFESKAIVHYTTNCYRKYNNAALLIGTYAIAVKQMNPKLVYKTLNNNDYHVDENSIFGYGKNHIDLYDCLCVINKVVNYRLVDFNNFSCQKYYWSPDFTWIVPNKFIAFRDPAQEYPSQHNDLKFYVKYFQKNNVKSVVRLNSIEYNDDWFSNADIEHIDLYFADGSVPTNAILQTFLELSEQTPNAIAVHCKAGLGRTGTLIAAYLIQHYRMTARESIAWMRICRPGSIMGPQQSFLMDNESMLWKKGDELRKEKYGSVTKLTYCTQGIYSVEPQRKAVSIRNWHTVKNS